IETDEELRERFKYIIQNPRTSGNVNNYKEWALECDGVGRVKVYPLWNGNGTVKVLVIGNDNLPCSTETINEVKNYIEEKRPIGATVTVETPSILNLTFDIKIKLDSAYSLDDTEMQISTVLHDYINKLNDEDIIYYKALSTVGDLDSVDDIVTFTINDKQENIAVGDYYIPVIDTITVTVSEVV
ncbi:MAG: baseplate J/gp47 family protein, partial [Romboutsia timonensis]